MGVRGCEPTQTHAGCGSRGSQSYHPRSHWCQFGLQWTQQSSNSVWFDALAFVSGRLGVFLTITVIHSPSQHRTSDDVATVSSAAGHSCEKRGKHACGTSPVWSGVGPTPHLTFLYIYPISPRRRHTVLLQTAERHRGPLGQSESTSRGQRGRPGFSPPGVRR